MAQHAYCGRRSPAELLARLRAAPTGLAGDVEADAKGELAGALVAILERLVCEIATLSAHIEHAFAQLPDGKIVMSFPLAGRTCAAQILAELGDVRERFQTQDQLAAEAGVFPVTHACGKSRGVVFRWACNKSLRLAITCFATTPVTPPPGARPSISKPATVAASIRTPSNPRPSLARVLWTAWRNKALYDPQQHRAAIKITG